MEKATLKRIQQYRKLRANAQEKGDFAKEAEFLNYLGGLHSEIGEHDEALIMHKEELGICQKLGHKIKQAVAHRKMGECYVEVEDYSKALQHQEKHLELARLVGDVREEQRAIVTIGRTYLIQGEDLHNSGSHDEAMSTLQEAKRAFEKSIHVCETLQGYNSFSENEVQLMKTRSITNLAYVYHFMSLNSSKGMNAEYAKQSLALYQKALIISRKYMLCEETQRANIQLIMHYRTQMQMADAFRHAEETVRYAKVAKNSLWHIDALKEMADVALDCGRCESARKALKKLFRLFQSDEDKEEIKQKLKTVVKILHLQSRVKEVAADVRETFKVFDKIADRFCELKCFQMAFNNYKKQEEMLPFLEDLTNKEKADVYYSLAQTSCDLCNYRAAVEYYKKEAKCLAEPRELADTWSQVGKCLEKLADDFIESECAYRKAVEYAEQTKDNKLQLKLFDLLLDLQVTQSLPSATETRIKIAELQIKSGTIVEEGDSEDLCGNPLKEMTENADDYKFEEEEDSNFLVEKELETVSSDDSDAEENRKTRATAHHWKKKRNEKGETALHVACIEGHLKRVHLLLQQGHPVNEPDHAGWVPLHEACNYGFTEIARVLLDHGANVNYMANCGTTPLQDAASNGHVDIVTLLLERGADTQRKNKKGDTALSSLENWFSKEQYDLDCDVVESYWTVHKSLSEPQNEEANHNSNRNFENIAAELIDFELFTQETSAGRENSTFNPCGSKGVGLSPRSRNACQTQNFHNISKTYDGFCPGTASDSVFRAHLISHASDPKRLISKPLLCDGSRDLNIGGTDEYNEAIASLGGSALLTRHMNRAESSRAPKRSSHEELGGLTDENDYVGDDWLVDDLANATVVGSGRPPKRLKTDCFLHTYQSSSLSSGQEKTNSVTKPWKESNSGVFTSSFLNSNSSQRRNHCLKKLVTRKNRDHHSQSIAINDADGDNIDDSQIWSGSVSRDAFASAKASSSRIGDKIQQADLNSIRVKMEINGEIFLIPVPDRTKKIAWLAKTASERYGHKTGLQPKLALFATGTANKGEVCLLSTDDSVFDVLRNDEHVIAEVESWETVPLTQKYEETCIKRVQAVIPVVLSVCHQSSTTGNIYLQNQGLLNRHLKPLATSLAQSDISSICLPGNQLCNGGAVALCEALELRRRTLNSSLKFGSHLSELNLSCSNLTCLGLKELARAAESGAFKDLHTVDMSCNRFGDLCSIDLASILKHCSKSLKNLNISRCRFTKKLFQTDYPTFKSAMQGCSSLLSLDASHNSFGSVGAEILLKTLPHISLLTLDLSGLCTATDNLFITRHLISFIKQEDCKLQSLHMPSNHLNSTQLADFLSNLKSVAHLNLRCLDLSRNDLDSSAEIRLSSLLTDMKINSLECYSLNSGYRKWEKCPSGLPLKKREITEAHKSSGLETTDTDC